MKVKKLILILSIVMLAGTLIACSSDAEESSNMYEFSQTKVTEQLDNIDFEFQLPQKLPFKVENVQINQPPTNQPRFGIEFYGQEDEYLSLDVINTDISLSSQNETEKVQIGDTEGTYLENKQGAKILYWEENGIHYQLSSMTTETDEGYSKNDLIRIGKNFN